MTDSPAAAADANLTELERVLRARLAAKPRDFEAALQLGTILLRANKYDEGIAAVDRAASLNPGHAAPFTLKAMTVFRRHFGLPPSPETRTSEQRAVSMRTLGMNGKFGNQLLQYAFLRLYARQHGLVAEAPDWIGRDLFGFDDSLPGNRHPSVDENNADFFASLNGSSDIVYENRDLIGYFCRHTAQWGDRAKDFRALYTPSSKIGAILEQASEALRQRGKTLVAVHIRRGDFGYGPFWIAPAAWYHAWLDGIWESLQEPVLYVASDDPSVTAEFAKFDPTDARMLGVSLPGAEFYLDHYFLSKARHLAISNSTFSFTAAMLNDNAEEFVRPDPNARSLMAFAPWNAEVLLRPNPGSREYSREEETILARWIGPDHVVVHAGEFCSAWTTLTRARHPNLNVIEISGDDSLDEVRRRRELRHVNHLIIEQPEDFAKVINAGAQTFRHARVDLICFKTGVDGTPDAAAAEHLESQGYRFFELAGDALLPMSPEALGSIKTCIAIHERMLNLILGPPVTGLDLPALCTRHRITVRGVIHVGAHEGKELAVYDKLGAERVLFVEANPVVFARLAAAVSGKGHVVAVNRAICDHYGKVDLHLASFDQSSSLFPMHQHLNVYPHIVPVGIVSVDAAPLDGILEELGVSFSAFNFLAIDVQGAEALVLKGASAILSHIEAINIEVSFAELYRDAAQIEDIETLLAAAGFQRVSLISASHLFWGDAFYVRAWPDALGARHSSSG